jgi:hypothetical protein
MTPVPSQVQAWVDRLLNQPLPSLGSPDVLYPFILTEPEISALYASWAFVKSACADIVENPVIPSDFRNAIARYIAHYAPTLEKLDQRLQEFDDQTINVNVCRHCGVAIEKPVQRHPGMCPMCFEMCSPLHPYEGDRRDDAH